MPRQEVRSREGHLHVRLPLFTVVRVRFRTTFKLFCPCAPKFGFAPVSVGAALGIPCCTVKPLVSVALWPSELVIMMLREPSVALDRMLMVAVICVAEL